MAWSRLTATGFRDTTRLASGAVGLWRAIFLHNRAALREALAALRGQLERYDAALEAADGAALAALLEAAKAARDGLG